MMGVNIPDMIQIIKEHGLIPVPVDYNLDTMTPNNWDDIKNLTTEKVIGKRNLVNHNFIDQGNVVRLPLRCKL
jgi:hypothetical protein